MRRRTRSQPVSLGKLVPLVLDDLGLGSSARVVRVAQHWEQALGAETARYCRPTRFRGETLEVEVDSSARGQELVLRTPAILAALRELVGDDAPAKIRFRLG